MENRHKSFIHVVDWWRLQMVMRVLVERGIVPVKRLRGGKEWEGEYTERFVRFNFDLKNYLGVC